MVKLLPVGVRRFIHSRRVESGKYPLYRLVVVGMTTSGVLQAIYGEVPETVANQTPHYFDTVFIVFQLLGGLVILASLYVPTSDRVTMRDVMAVERIGCILTAAACLIYFVTVCYNNNGPPLSSGLWLVAAFGVYCVYRVWEITRGGIVIAAATNRQNSSRSGANRSEGDG